MISKNEVKYIQSLYHKKHRQQENLFVVETPKLIQEVLQSNYVIEKIFATEQWHCNSLNTAPISVVSNDELKKISALQTPNQVLALVKMKASIENVDTENKINIVLDNIQDPGNMGTIIRIADWFGIANIICSNDCVELYNPKVIQSTMGSFVRTNIVYTQLEKFLQQTNLPIYGAVLNGKNIKEITAPQQALLVIGNEGNGISENILPYIKNKISIAKKGNAESLNAAIATGILAWWMCG